MHLVKSAMNGIHSMLSLFAFIQARSQSSRFPKKIFQSLENEHTILDEILQRVEQVLPKSNIVVLIPENDFLLIDFLKKRNVLFFEGSEENVLDRFYQASIQFKAEFILRLTADNPFIDIFYLDCLIQSYLEKPVDLATIYGLPIGMTGEIFKSSALSSKMITEQRHKEHVTLHIKENPKLFSFVRLKILDLDNSISSKIRLTLDEKDDFEVLKSVFDSLALKKKFFGWKDILQLYRESPNTFLKNQKVQQIQFQLPSLDTLDKKKTLILCGNPKQYGSGHFQRMKYLYFLLQLERIDCDFLYEIPKNIRTYDLVICDKRDEALPQDLKNVLLIDHCGKERKIYNYHDVLLNDKNNQYFDFRNILIPPILKKIQKQEGLEKTIVIYAGSLSEEVFQLDLFLKEHFVDKDIIRVGGSKPKIDIQYFQYLQNFSFYQLMIQSEIFISYYGQSLMEALFLKKKVYHFSISDYHHHLSNILENDYKIPYIGSLDELEKNKLIEHNSISIDGNGYNLITGKIMKIYF